MFFQQGSALHICLFAEHNGMYLSYEGKDINKG